MKPFVISEHSSFVTFSRISIPSLKMEIEEETVQQTKVIKKPVKIIFPPPNEVPIVAKKACNCKKSQCLKQYCDCFANGQTCSEDCNCVGCMNSETNAIMRKKAK